MCTEIPAGDKRGCLLCTSVGRYLILEKEGAYMLCTTVPLGGNNSKTSCLFSLFFLKCRLLFTEGDSWGGFKRHYYKVFKRTVKKAIINIFLEISHEKMQISLQRKEFHFTSGHFELLWFLLWYLGNSFEIHI